MADSGVDKQIYMGERITIFGASSVKVGVIDVESSFSVIFMDQDYIRQPSG